MHRFSEQHDARSIAVTADINFSGFSGILLRIRDHQREHQNQNRRKFFDHSKHLSRFNFEISEIYAIEIFSIVPKQFHRLHHRGAFQSTRRSFYPCGVSMYFEISDQFAMQWISITAFRFWKRIQGKSFNHASDLQSLSLIKFFKITLCFVSKTYFPLFIQIERLPLFPNPLQ